MSTTRLAELRQLPILRDGNQETYRAFLTQLHAASSIHFRQVNLFDLYKLAFICQPLTGDYDDNQNSKYKFGTAIAFYLNANIKNDDRPGKKASPAQFTQVWNLLREFTKRNRAQQIWLLTQSPQARYHAVLVKNIEEPMEQYVTSKKVVKEHGREVVEGKKGNQFKKLKNQFGKIKDIVFSTPEAALNQVYQAEHDQVAEFKNEWAVKKENFGHHDHWAWRLFYDIVCVATPILGWYWLYQNGGFYSQAHTAKSQRVVDQIDRGLQVLETLQPEVERRVEFHTQLKKLDGLVDDLHKAVQQGEAKDGMYPGQDKILKEIGECSEALGASHGKHPFMLVADHLQDVFKEKANLVAEGKSLGEGTLILLANTLIDSLNSVHVMKHWIAKSRTHSRNGDFVSKEKVCDIANLVMFDYFLKIMHESIITENKPGHKPLGIHNQDHLLNNFGKVTKALRDYNPGRKQWLHGFAGVIMLLLKKRYPNHSRLMSVKIGNQDFVKNFKKRVSQWQPTDANGQNKKKMIMDLVDRCELDIQAQAAERVQLQAERDRVSAAALPEKSLMSSANEGATPRKRGPLSPDEVAKRQHERYTFGMGVIKLPR